MKPTVANTARFTTASGASTPTTERRNSASTSAITPVEISWSSPFSRSMIRA
jgi:hypothetical protein